MTSHLGVMLLFAACVSTVFGTLLRDEPRDQVRLGGRIFTGLVLGAYALGWLMYFRCFLCSSAVSWRWTPVLACMAAIFVASSMTTCPNCRPASRTTRGISSAMGRSARGAARVRGRAGPASRGARLKAVILASRSMA